MVSIPDRVLEALKLLFVDCQKSNLAVSIPERVLEALKLQEDRFQGQFLSFNP